MAWLPLLLLGLLSPSPLFADPPTPATPPGNLSPQATEPRTFGLSFGAEIGAGQISRDTTLTLRPFFDIWGRVPMLLCNPLDCGTTIEVQLEAPVRLVLQHSNLSGIPDTGIFRSSDWNSWSDYFSTVRRLSYGHFGEPVFFQFGELSQVTLGHGTIVNRYTNRLNPEDPESGVRLAVQTSGGGLSAFFDDVTDPDLFVGRAFLRPFGFDDKFSLFDHIAIGGTFGSHFAAPTTLATNDQKELVYNSRGLPNASNRDTKMMLGVDIEFATVDLPNLLLKHYIDINLLDGSTGAHIGTSALWQVNDELELTFTGELRGFSRQYIPTYVSTLFEIEQYTTAGWDLPDSAQPLITVASANQGSGMGGMLEILVDLHDILLFGATYEGHHRAHNDRLTLSLTVTPTSWLQGALHYINQNGNFILDLINPTRAFVSAEVRGQLFGPLYSYGSYYHRIRLRKDAHMIHIHDWEVGLGVNWSL